MVAAPLRGTSEDIMTQDKTPRPYSWRRFFPLIEGPYTWRRLFGEPGPDPRPNPDYGGGPPVRPPMPRER